MEAKLLNGGVKSEKDVGIDWKLSTRQDGNVEVVKATRNGVELTVKEILDIYPKAGFYKEHDTHIIG